MDSVGAVEAFRLATLIVWGIVFVTTVPFLVLAARGHQRSTLMTVAILGVFGVLVAAFQYDTVRVAPEGVHRPLRQWVDLYGGSVASLAMALVLGFRVWSVMLGRSE